MSDVLLDVKDLSVSFHHPRRGELRAVSGINYTVKKGEIMGLVGESGSGKSVEAYSIMGLLGASAKIEGGSAHFEGRDILAMTKKELESFRGGEASMIFQNPRSFLDPVYTIGRQMVETILAHDNTVTKSEAKSRSLDMLRDVMIRNREHVMRQYPFELSGGMCQRIMIAIALLCNPKLLIADEPTTSLDVTTQAQIIQILKGFQSRSGMSMIYITHNFGIVAELCDKVSVMYAGCILEQGPTDDIFYRAAHPYTQMLHKMTPRMDSPAKEPSQQVEWGAFDPYTHPPGCVFHPRCPSCMEVCRSSIPPMISLDSGHSACCWLLVEGMGQGFEVWGSGKINA